MKKKKGVKTQILKLEKVKNRELKKNKQKMFNYQKKW